MKKQLYSLLFLTTISSVYSFDDDFEDTETSDVVSSAQKVNNNRIQKKYTNQQILDAQDKLYDLMKDDNFDISKHKNLVDIVNYTEPGVDIIIDKVSVLQRVSDLENGKRQKATFFSKDTKAYETKLFNASTPSELRRVILNNKAIDSKYREIDNKASTRKSRTEIEMAKRYALRKLILLAEQGDHPEIVNDFVTMHKEFLHDFGGGEDLRQRLATDREKGFNPEHTAVINAQLEQKRKQEEANAEYDKRWEAFEQGHDYEEHVR